MIPLARALSKLGLASRSDARALILAGRVRVNGRLITNPTTLVTPERIRLSIDGREARAAEPLTILFHKPRGVVTTRRDPEGRATVYDFIAGVNAHVVPVGRLDFATSGLLLLTNDTHLADWLTDPANEIPRLYLVTVRGRVTQDELDALQVGITDRGERLHAQSVALRKASTRESLLIVELTEGKNREIRRMVEAIGHEVTRLRRVQFGGLAIGDLAPGTWRRLTRAELRRAFPAAPLRAKK